MKPVSPGDTVGVPGVSEKRSATDGEALRSLVLASDYRFDDVERMWSLIKDDYKDDHSPLAEIGAHHVVVYTSILEPNRVLVTIGIRHRASVTELLRSPAVFEWFDRAGVNDIPAIFAGEVLEKIDLTAPGTGTTAGVIVGAVSTVADVSELMAEVHGGLERFRGAGVRKLWVYQAIDDGREVMTLLEIDSEASARHWIDRPDAAAEWMSSTGSGGYPRLFVGKLAHVMNLISPEAVRWV
jgi:hypothetical protein